MICSYFLIPCSALTYIFDGMFVTCSGFDIYADVFYYMKRLFYYMRQFRYYMQIFCYSIQY